jgi:hypothetical protein
MKSIGQLNNLYGVILGASTKRDLEEYRLSIFEGSMQYDRMAEVFAEFELQYYYNVEDGERDMVDVRNVTREQLREFLRHRVKPFGALDGEDRNYALDSCACGQDIYHCFVIKNKHNGNTVRPIGRICIFRFAPEETKEVLKQFERSFASVKREIKNEKEAWNALKDRIADVENKCPSRITALETRLRRFENIPSYREEALSLRNELQQRLMVKETLKLRTKTDRRLAKQQRKQKFEELKAELRRLNDQLDPLYFNIKKIQTVKYIKDYIHNFIGDKY